MRALSSKQLAGLVLFLMWVRPCFGQSVQPPANRLDDLRTKGYEALYNLDYNTARQYFREMIQIAPDHPVGPQCMAASLWVQQLNDSWELKATLYSNKSYAEENLKLSPQQVTEFRNYIRQAKLLSQSRLRRDPGDKEALYLLGAAEGLEAAYSAAVERKFMSALRSASDSVEHHRALLKIDPEFHDAELTIGLYNYVVGSLPLPVKMLVGPMGIRGSKKRGLETLERVVKQGHWSRDVALLLLMDIYKRERRWSDAITVARELSSRYPRNYLFKLQLADALVSRILSAPSTAQSDRAEVVAIFDSLVSQRTENSDLIGFRHGESMLLLGDTVGAQKQFQLVTNHSAADPALRSLSQLRVAQCLDVSGKRSEALTLYKTILASSKSKQVQEEARRGLREPFNGSFR